MQHSENHEPIRLGPVEDHEGEAADDRTPNILETGDRRSAPRKRPESGEHLVQRDLEPVAEAGLDRVEVRADRAKVSDRVRREGQIH